MVLGTVDGGTGLPVGRIDDRSDRP